MQGNDPAIRSRSQKLYTEEQLHFLQSRLPEFERRLNSSVRGDAKKYALKCAADFIQRFGVPPSSSPTSQSTDRYTSQLYNWFKNTVSRHRRRAEGRHTQPRTSRTNPRSPTSSTRSQPMSWVSPTPSTSTRGSPISSNHGTENGVLPASSMSPYPPQRPMHGLQISTHSLSVQAIPHMTPESSTSSDSFVAVPHGLPQLSIREAILDPNFPPKDLVASILGHIRTDPRLHSQQVISPMDQLVNEVFNIVTTPREGWTYSHALTECILCISRLLDAANYFPREWTQDVEGPRTSGSQALAKVLTAALWKTSVANPLPLPSLSTEADLMPGSLATHLAHSFIPNAPDIDGAYSFTANRHPQNVPLGSSPHWHSNHFPSTTPYESNPPPRPEKQWSDSEERLAWAIIHAACLECSVFSIAWNGVSCIHTDPYWSSPLDYGEKPILSRPFPGSPQGSGTELPSLTSQYSTRNNNIRFNAAQGEVPHSLPDPYNRRPSYALNHATTEFTGNSANPLSQSSATSTLSANIPLVYQYSPSSFPNAPPVSYSNTLQVAAPTKELLALSKNLAVSESMTVQLVNSPISAEWLRGAIIFLSCVRTALTSHSFQSLLKHSYTNRGVVNSMSHLDDGRSGGFFQDRQNQYTILKNRYESLLTRVNDGRFRAIFTEVLSGIRAELQKMEDHLPRSEHSVA